MSEFRAILVGAGGMGRAWGKNLLDHPEVELAAWVDIKKEAAASAAEELQIKNLQTYDDLSKAIAEIKPDFVVDVTIPEAHHDVTLTALTAGLPVIGEKPMAHSMAAAREMVAASEKSGKLYMVSQSRRYDARIAAYKKLVRENLGKLGILNSDFYIGAHFGGFRDVMEHVLLLDMAIHTFDAARYITDTDPISVYCEEFNPEWSWYQGASGANALFEMSNGLHYTYRGCWSAEGRMTSWEGEWRAVGENGTATWNGFEQIKADKLEKSGGFHSKMESKDAEITPEVGGISGSLSDFLNALKHGTTPMGECHDNIKSLAMVFSSIESAMCGNRVPIHYS